MQELMAFNEQRAEIYWWLSSLLSHELTEKDIYEYQNGEMLTFLSNLTMTPELKSSAEQLRDAIQRLSSREDTQLELAADFCALFLSTPKTSALPYASMYVGKSGLLNDTPAQETEAWLSRYDIALKKEFNEPADHIGVQLDFMGNLIIRSSQQESEQTFEESMQAQREFLSTMLLNWLPGFEKQCRELDTFGFYSAVVTLLLAYCQLDSVFLTGE